MNFKFQLMWLRVVALLEGLSLIALVFIAMPYKYLLDKPELVKTIGMTHGVLFLLFVSASVIVKPKSNWDNKSFFIVLLSSIIPFGTFYSDKKYFKPLAI
jgi:integral membrane protein